MYDGKEFFIQKTNYDQFISQVDHESIDKTYNILVREINGSNWKFGQVYEVRIDRLLTGKKFADFLHTNLFPHIPLSSLWATRVDITKPFVRADLAI